MRCLSFRRCYLQYANFSLVIIRPPVVLRSSVSLVSFLPDL